MKRRFEGYIEPRELYRTNESFYNSPSCQYAMLEDRSRTLSFKRAIFEKVKRGFTVTDFGTGSGILAIFAALAGAKKVYAIEWSPIAPIAENIVNHNKLSKIVYIINKDIRKTKPPKVDLFVSECLGHLGYDEDMVGVFLNLRDTLLKKGGKVIPEDITLFLAPTNYPQIYKEYIEPWRYKKYTLDFSPLGIKAINHIYVVPIKPLYLISESKSINTCDLKMAQSYDFESYTEFLANKRTTLYGLCGWFESRLSKNVILSTAPDKPITHWEQCFLPVEPIKVNKEDMIKVRFSVKRLRNFKVKFSWNVLLEGYESKHVCIV